MTRFGKVSTLWQTPQSLGKFIEGLFTSWQKLDLLWQILYAIGQIFVDVNGQMLENNLAVWSHCSTPKENDTMLQVELDFC